MADALLIGNLGGGTHFHKAQTEYMKRQPFQYMQIANALLQRDLLGRLTPLMIPFLLCNTNTLFRAWSIHNLLVLGERMSYLSEINKREDLKDLRSLLMGLCVGPGMQDDSLNTLYAQWWSCLYMLKWCLSNEIETETRQMKNLMSCRPHKDTTCTKLEADIGCHLNSCYGPRRAARSLRGLSKTSWPQSIFRCGHSMLDLCWKCRPDHSGMGCSKPEIQRLWISSNWGDS